KNPDPFDRVLGQFNVCRQRQRDEEGQHSVLRANRNAIIIASARLGCVKIYAIFTIFQSSARY
ncbi:MAG TPA: hypothetical protein VHO48_14440, partial [Anaerolineaceae bacterium]|nr:hypothetical protein [Anaerolineaceae bacterium]